MKSLQIKVDDITYDITELSMREVLPVMESVEANQLSIELTKLAVKVKGKPLGDAVLDLGFSTYSKLSEAVNTVHGFGGDTKND